MKATDAEEEIPSRDELEKMITQGLRLQLESIQRKNPYFKGSRRGPEYMKMLRKERSAALSFTRHFVGAYFAAVRQVSGLVSRN